MAKKTSSKAEKGRFDAYKSGKIWKANRVRSLERHLQTHPHDEIALAALAKAKTDTVPRRRSYKAGKASGAGLSNRFMDMIAKVVKGALKAASYNKKKETKEKKTAK